MMVLQGKEHEMITRQIHDYKTTPATVTTVQEMVGRTLYVANEVVQVMSDVWENHLVATSIDEKGCIQKFSVSGWFGMQPGDAADFAIDATEQAYTDYSTREFNMALSRFTNDAESQVVNPAVKGRVVKVVRGRNTPKGVVGKVVVIIERPYGMGWHSSIRKKLGIATSHKTVEKVMPNGKVFKNHADMVWVWAHNCEVERPEAVDAAALDAKAREFAYSMVQGLRKTAMAHYQPRTDKVAA